MGADETDRDYLSRRTVLQAAAGIAGPSLIVGSSRQAQAQSERPDFGGWLDGVDGGFRDARGESDVTVQVGADGNQGAFAFSPAGLWVDPGTTVTWEWTGNGGQHNVNAQQGAGFESELTEEEGFTFQHTFEDEGITTYQCDPHASLGMKGAIAVGDDVPLAGGSDGGGGAEIALPGDTVGAVFLGVLFSVVGLAVAAVFAGEFLGAVRAKTGDGPRSAYTVGAAIAVVALVVLLVIIAQLVLFG